MRPSVGIAMVAVLALAGTATAAKLITGKQIKDSSITGKDVKNRFLTAKDFRGSVRGAPGPAGPAGPKGDTGPQGPAGPRGAAGTNGTNGTNGTDGTDGTNGATDVAVRKGPDVTVPNEGPIVRDASVDCLPGERATGGGIDSSGFDTYAIVSRPTPATGVPTGWFVRARNTSGPTSGGGSASNLAAYVICSSP